jgi:hypothetical protein
MILPPNRRELLSGNNLIVNGELLIVNLFIMKKIDVKDKRLYFAIRIVKLYKFLTNNKTEFVISKQLLRSETGVGA